MTAASNDRPDLSPAPIDQISKISFRNYRMFGRNVYQNVILPGFDLAPLTLITGHNHSGKSAIVEAISLLDRNYRSGSLPIRGIALDPNEAEIVGDRLDNIWGISLEDRSSKEYSWTFLAKVPSQLLLAPLNNRVLFDRFPFAISAISGLNCPLLDREFDLLETLSPGSVLTMHLPEHNLTSDQQSELGRRIARSVDRGLQVIVETHSDHIINGVRVAIKQGMVHWQQVKVWYFTGSPTVRGGYRQYSIEFDKNARSNDWRKGFNDRWDRDLEELLET